MSAKANGNRSRLPAAAESCGIVFNGASPPALGRRCAVIIVNCDHGPLVSWDDTQTYDDPFEAAEYARQFNRFCEDGILDLEESRAYVLVEAEGLASAMNQRFQALVKGGVA